MGGINAGCHNGSVGGEGSGRGLTLGVQTWHRGQCPSISRDIRVAVGYDVAPWGVATVSRGIGVAAGSDVAPQDVILASRGGGVAVGPDLAPQGVVLVLRGIGVAIGSDMAPWRWVSVMVSTRML